MTTVMPVDLPALFEVVSGIAFKNMLFASEPPAEKRPELSLFLADMQLLMVELFERIHAERAPGPPSMLH